MAYRDAMDALGDRTRRAIFEQLRRGPRAVGEIADELPIRRSVTVNCSVEHAFATFTERIHEWWPLASHSIDAGETGSAAQTVIFQGGAGGQVFERTKGGE